MAINAADQIVDGLAFNGTQAAPAPANFTFAKTIARVQAKTTSYTVLESDSGTIFTNYGSSGAFTWTLPANPKKGLHYWFVSYTADDMLIATAAASGLIALSDATANSVTCTEIGVITFVFADGNMWYAPTFAEALAAVTQTIQT